MKQVTVIFRLMSATGNNTLFLCLSHRDDSPHFGTENVAALQIFSDIQRRFAVPAESPLACPPRFWPVLVLWVFSLPIAAR